jgi:hypothetical protein
LISEDGANTLYTNVDDKPTFALQQERKAKISRTPLRIPEILRVCRGRLFHGNSVRILLIDQKINKKLYSSKVTSLNFHNRINKINSEDYYTESLMK